jgi:hypothetical protein
LSKISFAGGLKNKIIFYFWGFNILRKINHLYNSENRLMKKAFLMLAFGVTSLYVFSQTQDPNSPGFDFGTTTPTDTTTPTPIEGEGNGEESEQTPVVKPYVRIILNVDSVTNLISYVGVVEQEETGSDSLYIRAKRWATQKFAGGTSKAIFDVDKKNQKLVINAWLPAYAYGNKYAKRDIGKYEFKVTIWIKEGRYKYQISNFVHEAVKPAQGTPQRNYFEYYYTATTNIKGNDQMLRFADRDINLLVENMKKNMKDPIVVDEEEW